MPVPLSLLSALQSKQANTSNPLPDSFEVFVDGVPEGWTVTSGSASRFTADTSYFTDGSQSVKSNSNNAVEQRIEKNFDLSAYTTLKIDCNEGGAGGYYVTMEVYDDQDNLVDSVDMFEANTESGFITFSVDVSTVGNGRVDLVWQTNGDDKSTNYAVGACDYLRGE